MSLDLGTNGDELRSAVDAILNGKNTWYGTDRNSLFEEFSPSRVMFGFTRIQQSSKPSSLPAKFVLINWQGEGAPERLKIACSQHGNDVKRLCRTTHLTVHARNDDDLDWDDLLTRVAKVSGTDYTKAPPSTIDWNPPVVGSVYKPVDVSADIPKNSSQLAFWKQRSMTDETQQPPEKPKKPAGLVRPIAQAPVDVDPSVTKSRALKEARKVEVASAIRDRILKIDESENGTNHSSYKKIDPRTEIMLAKQLSETSFDDMDSGPIGTNWQRTDPRAEILAARRQSKQESESDNTTSVGTNYQRPDVQAEIRAARSKHQEQHQPPVNSTTHVTPHQATIQPEQKAASQDQPAMPSPAQIPSPLPVDTIQNNQPIDQINHTNGEKTNGHAVNLQNNNNGHDVTLNSTNNNGHDLTLNNTTNNNGHDVTLHNNNNNGHGVDLNNNDNNGHHVDAAAVHESSLSHPPPPAPPVAAAATSGPVAVCLFDYAAREEDELTFIQGDNIYEVQQIDAGWWLGMTSDGHQGLFPANYVELIA